MYVHIWRTRPHRKSRFGWALSLLHIHVIYVCFTFFYVFALEQNRAVHLSFRDETSKFYFGSFFTWFFLLDKYKFCSPKPAQVSLFKQSISCKKIS